MRYTFTYPSAEDILRIHSDIIEQTGGAHGVRDIGRIESMVSRPKQQMAGKDLYPTVFEKAAVYFEVSAFHHPFTDGNKRTAITIADTFLFNNGHELTASNRQVVDFVLEAVINKFDLKSIADWFQKNTKNIKRAK